jgi:alkylhydroperoxidase family enzyme
VTDEQMRDLADFEDSAAFSALEKLALRYAEALTQTPAEVPDDLFDALRQRLSERQVVELTAAIAWANFRARFSRAFAAESEGFAEGACCRLAVGEPC